MFRGRDLVIATKHKKEKVIAPVLEKELQVKCFVAEEFDTDILGTFSGEIERTLDPISAARKKCFLAMDLAKKDIALASEGSFGPHPEIPFVPANEEILVFIDRKNDIEIIVKEISLDTNFSGIEVRTEKDLSDFIKRARFPSHGVIIRHSKDNITDIVKGITEPEYLERTFRSFINKYGFAFIETDMRALYNPTRMQVIEKATHKLVRQINSRCPQCDFPGFGIVEAKPGLPCEQCNTPTRSTLSYLYICKKCKYTKEELYPHGKKAEDPQYCDYCNP